MKKNAVLFFVFASVIFGGAYNLYLSTDYLDNPDIETYLHIANGEFEGQSLVRRYRVVVPFLAKVVAYPLERVYHKVWKKRGNDNGPLRLGFLLVNTLMMAGAGLLAYHLANRYLSYPLYSFLAVIAFLTAGRFGSILAGLPMTDSFYMVCITLFWLGIKTNQPKWVMLACLMGIVAKESFLLFLPMIYCVKSLEGKSLAVFGMIIGFGIALGIRYIIDGQTNTSLLSSVERDLTHLELIGLSLRRICDVRGIGELCTVMGFFSLVIALALFSGPSFWKKLKPKLDMSFWFFVAIIWFHALISYEVGRMLYIGGAAWVVLLGLVVEHHPWCQSLTGLWLNRD